MQAGAFARGTDAIRSHGRLNALPAVAAVLVIAAAVALLAWTVPLTTSGLGAEDAIPRAEPSRVTLYDDGGKAHRVDVRVGGVEDAPPWVRLHDAEGNVYLVHAG